MYRNVLVATDLSPDTSDVIGRAGAIAGDAKVAIAHVIEPLALAYGAEMPVDLAALQEEISRQARRKLDEVADRLGIAAEDRLLVTGTISREILRIARERGTDLIVIGSHSRRGLASLLGSTANAVLHHAPCDVLAVRIATH